MVNHSCQTKGQYSNAVGGRVWSKGNKPVGGGEEAVVEEGCWDCRIWRRRRRRRASVRERLWGEDVLLGSSSVTIIKSHRNVPATPGILLVGRKLGCSITPAMVRGDSTEEVGVQGGENKILTKQYVVKEKSNLLSKLISKPLYYTSEHNMNWECE